MKYLISTIFTILILILLSTPLVAGTLYFPHIASIATWETEICLINTSTTQNLTGTLTAYNNSGQTVTSKSLSLGPGVRQELVVGSELSNPDQIGYILFESNSDSIIGYTKFFIDSKYRVAVPATSEINNSDIIIPHIASDSRWWTGISLLNTTASSKQLTIEFNDGTTKNRTINANEHQAFAIKQLFNNTPQPQIKSAVIKNGAGLVGLELFGSNDGITDNYLSGVLLKVDTTGSIYYPHIASDAEWWTGIVAYNPSSQACDLAITPYQIDGTELASQSLSLSGREKYINLAKNLNLPEDSACFKIDATHPITGFELFGAWSGHQLGGYTAVGINNVNGIFPKIENEGWTGIAFVNIDNETSTVTITAHDDNGTTLALETVTLSAHEKVVNYAASLFSANIDGASYIRYSSTSNIVGFQLNGSDCDMLLDALPADNCQSSAAQLLATKSINDQGGTVAVPEYSLTIPPNTFTVPAELKLYKIINCNLFETETFTDTFRLTGIPDEFPETLLPDIKFTGTLTGESFITVGEKILISSQQTPIIAHHLFPASSNSGFLTYALKATESEIQSSEKNFTKTRESAPTTTNRFLDFSGVSGLATYKADENLRANGSQSHFLIRYPTYFVSRTDLNPLFQYLEEAYSTYANLGFSYGGRSSWPIAVTVTNLPSGTYGLFCKSMWGNNSATLQFNQNTLGNLSDLRTTAGHEFFHFIQYLYDSRNNYSRGHDNAYSISLHWLNEATAVWAEEKFSNRPDYVSSIRNRCEMAPFKGMEAGAGGNITQAGEHGYGMSAFIKYLVNRYGDSIIREIYLKILDQHHPVQAINLATNYNLFMIWEPFLREYVKGNIYNVPLTEFLAISEKPFRVRSEIDKTKNYTENYPDLSARLFIIGLDFPDISPAKAINFTIDQDLCDITLFKYRNSDAQIQYLSHSATKTLSHRDIRSLTDDGFHLLAMVSNPNLSAPYTNTKPIKLDIVIESIAAAITFNASPNTLNADGAGTSTITATVTDDIGGPVEGEKIIFTCNHGSLSESSAETNAGGIATVTYTAPGTVPASGSAAITATTTNNISASTTITLSQAQNLSWPEWPEPQWCPKTGSYHIIYDAAGKPDEVYCVYDQGILTGETPFFNNKRDGISKLYNSIAYTSGNFRAEIPYVNGNKNGFERWYYENGQIEKETAWLDDKKNGIYKEFFNSGIPRIETPYVDDKKSGVHKDYFVNGQLRNEWPYVNDQPHGLCKSYYASGQLQGTTPYLNGQRNGLGKSYYESGQLHFDTPYVNNMKNGTMKEYYESGSIKYETPYVDDIKNGTEVYYYENGGRVSETPWVAGVKHGQVKGYSEDGQMTSCLNYDNGTNTGSCMP